MYKIKDGILHKDGKKIYALGESYYPSFNPSKFPVKPEDDRIGEMKKDLRTMAEAGFNHVRFAALGEVKLENGTVSVDAPFIDAMCKEANKNDISVSIREQGFSVNLRGFKDADMIDWNGDTPEFAWHDFVRTTLSHEGILEDNRTYAKALSEHFSKFDNTVGFQIYNEPKHPCVGKAMMDYHPKTIETYRKWLVEKKILTETEAFTYEPPHRRNEQSDTMWALWRLFSRDNLTAFLNNASDGSKEGSPLPTFTCFTSSQISANNAYSGNNMFDNAKCMDIVGYTTYLHAMGADYYVMCLQADLAQCAAELEKKQSWCIELDSRTYIPLPVYNRGTYTILGSGCKGIVYYQWRGDCPVPGVPYPNSCGILNYDGTKTANFDNAVNVNRFINKMSNLLVDAHRLHEGVGLLHSDYGVFLSDARENNGIEDRPKELCNRYLIDYTQMYRELRDAGFNVSITDAEHLEENPFDIKVLYVPHINMLSPEEKEKVDALREKGVRIFENTYTSARTGGIAYKEYLDVVLTHEEKAFDPYFTVDDVSELTGIKPSVTSLTPSVNTQMLEGDGYKIVVLINTSSVKESTNAKIRVNIPFESAEFCAFDGKKVLEINGNEITVQDITDGGFIILR